MYSHKTMHTSESKLNRELSKCLVALLMVDSLLDGLPGSHSGTGPTCPCKRHKRLWVPFLGWEDPLEKEMASHCNILAWKVPRTEEPGGLQSLGTQKVGHD